MSVKRMLCFAAIAVLMCLPCMAERSSAAALELDAEAERQIAALADKCVEAYMYFDLCECVEYDGEVTASGDSGTVYCKVIDSRIPSYEFLEELLYSTFTPQTAQMYLSDTFTPEGPLYMVFDGELYINTEAKSPDFDFTTSNSRIETERFDGEECVFRFFYYELLQDRWTPYREISCPGRAVRTEDGWRLTYNFLRERGSVSEDLPDIKGGDFVWTADDSPQIDFACRNLYVGREDIIGLVENNIEAVYLLYVSELPWYADDGCASDRYTSYSQIESLIRSTYTQDTAEHILEVCRYVPGQGVDASEPGSIALAHESSSEYVGKGYDVSWADYAVKVVSDNESGCSFCVSVDGREVMFEAQIEDGLYKLVNVYPCSAQKERLYSDEELSAARTESAHAENVSDENTMITELLVMSGCFMAAVWLLWVFWQKADTGGPTTEAD